MEAFVKEIMMKSQGAEVSNHSINNLLGLYKAEWMDGRLFDFFAEPTYFTELKTNRPCVLIGGRGTGKTTVLNGLSYLGQFHLANKDAAQVKNWAFYGLYYRVNTNRVTAFQGSELSDESWIKLFSHYINLIFVKSLLDFSIWYEREVGERIEVSSIDMEMVCVTLHLKVCDSLDALSSAVDLELARFEASINNISDCPPERLSIQGAPVDCLAAALLSTSSLAGKKFFFLIDEFENLLDYQQRVLNTLIKHANSSYTFKVGVRELGWRERSTLNQNEQLTHPADYVRIDIREQILEKGKFQRFAEEVLLSRIPREAIPSFDYLFPGLAEEEEAGRLLGKEYKEEKLADWKEKLPKEVMSNLAGMSPGNLYFFEYASTGRPLVEVYEEMVTQPEKWAEKRVNYFYASLFSIRRGKAGIRKYYCGWDTFVALADGNIRYLLELVHTALLRHFDLKKNINVPIDFETQTLAAQDVGYKNLSELEGLSVEGARLTKLLLSLGRIFQVMAEQAVGHTPEVNQFYIPELSEFSEKDPVKQILNMAVMHQALVRFAGSKLLDKTDTKDYDYMIHPIFSAFFVFSHRKKRKFKVSKEQIFGLINRPKRTIREVLANSNRTADDLIPDQLSLFGGFYDGD